MKQSILNDLTALLFLTVMLSCGSDTPTVVDQETHVTLMVLGNVQDAGSPHIACTKDCCKTLFERPDPNRKVVSLGICDPTNKSSFLFEATPDIAEQLKHLKNCSTAMEGELPKAVFLTHAHIGHYTGLMYFGKEAMGSEAQIVFAMPKMKSFLESNGPWDQLVSQNNIQLIQLTKDSIVKVNSNISVLPLTVPHRDEYSETVGYKIFGPNKTALFIPDIDKWEKWDVDIIREIAQVDYAFLDATFYDGEEINYRDISEIPHPFVVESMEKFNNLEKEEKEKIYFIHLNHTNPLLRENSAASRTVKQEGFNVARFGDNFIL